MKAAAARKMKTQADDLLGFPRAYLLDSLCSGSNPGHGGVCAFYIGSGSLIFSPAKDKTPFVKLTKEYIWYKENRIAGHFFSENPKLLRHSNGAVSQPAMVGAVSIFQQHYCA